MDEIENEFPVDERLRFILCIRGNTSAQCGKND
jgi:hypothetical protein